MNPIRWISPILIYLRLHRKKKTTTTTATTFSLFPIAKSRGMSQTCPTHHDFERHMNKTKNTKYRKNWGIRATRKGTTTEISVMSISHPNVPPPRCYPSLTSLDMMMTFMLMSLLDTIGCVGTGGIPFFKPSLRTKIHFLIIQKATI